MYGQQTKAAHNHSKHRSHTVSFIVKFDKKNATKDGYYLGGYIVEVDYDQAKKLYGKKVKITGRVHIVKGLKSQPKEYDKNGNEIMEQGRQGDAKHILSPVIEIIHQPD
jgi:uroporphyrinogen-III decarboxylase